MSTDYTSKARVSALVQLPEIFEELALANYEPKHRLNRLLAARGLLLAVLRDVSAAIDIETQRKVA